MARTFAGGLSTDRIVSNYGANATKRSYHVWTYRVGEGGDNSGRIFDKQAVGVALVELFLNQPTTYLYLRSWSGTDGQWSFPRPAANEWHQVGISYDSGATTNDPLMYLNGVSQTVTQVVGDPTGAADTGTDGYRIGNSSTADRAWDGRLCEFAVWDRLLTSSEWAALGKGMSPLFFPQSLVEYLPLGRDIRSLLRLAPSTTGTVFSEGPRITYPSGVSHQRRIVAVGPEV